MNGQFIDRERRVASVGADTGDTLTLTGWAVDPIAEQPAAGVFVRIDDRVTIPALYGQKRYDVSHAMSNPAYLNSGFTVSFGTFVLEPGQHSLALQVISADRTEVSVLNHVLVLDVAGPQVQTKCTP